MKDQVLPLNQKSLIPIGFPNKKGLPPNSIVLAGDIGGTKTNLALFKIRHDSLIKLREKSFHTKDFTSFLEMASAFQSNEPYNIDSICLGVAGPVVQGKVRGTNFPWLIDGNAISKELKVGSVSIINDMEANAYGLTSLRKKDFEVINKGRHISGNMVIISPGTGLGEVGLYWDGSNYHPFASEGGHCDFSPRNILEIALWHYMHHKYSHVSWERILSGSGIYDTYLFLIEYRGQIEPEWIQERMSSENPAAVITSLAMECKDVICRETLDLFTKFLAVESAQLALKMKATGGVFIGGGIVPKIIKGMNKTIFNSNFIQSGRLDVLLNMIPVNVILNEKTPLLGAAYYGAMAFDDYAQD